MRKVLIPIVLAAATIAATPAAAQYRGGYVPAQEIRRDIDQLENRIQRSHQRRAISGREAGSLRREANQIEQLFRRFSRNGLDRREYSILRSRIDNLRQRLREERRDDDNRRGDRRGW